MPEIEGAIRLMDKVMAAKDAIDEACLALNCRDVQAPCQYCHNYTACQMLTMAARAISTAINVIR